MKWFIGKLQNHGQNIDKALDSISNLLKFDFSLLHGLRAHDEFAIRFTGFTGEIMR